MLFWFMAGLLAHRQTPTHRIIHAHPIEFVRLPEQAQPEPLPRTRPPPPPPQSAKLAPALPQAVYGNVRELPIPELALKIEAPLAASVKIQAPALPSLLVEGEPAPTPAPPQIPTVSPSYISASELTALVRIPPLYPPEARSRRIEGRVVVEFTVTERGEVDGPVIVESHPPGVFDQAVLNSVRRWRFKPKEQDGKPVAVRARQPLEFKLRP